METKFSEADIAGAAFCAPRLTHANGYPQAEGDFLYREQTYHMSNYCPPESGTGLMKKVPLRVRKSLRRGRNSFLKLFWVNDAFFAQRAASKECLAPLSLETLFVQDVDGAELDDAFQLRTDPQWPLVMSDVEGDVCSVCGNERFNSHERDFFPAPAGWPSAPISPLNSISVRIINLGARLLSVRMWLVQSTRQVSKELSPGHTRYPCDQGSLALTGTA